MGSRKISRVLSIPDTHMPFTDWKRLSNVYLLARELKPDVIIQVGDLYDRISNSRFARQLTILPHEEISEGREGAVAMWSNLRKEAPQARLVQLKGNHDDRLLNRCMDRYPEVYSILQKADNDLFKFKNVRTVESSRDGIVIDDVYYVHGWLTTLGQHLMNIGKSVVHGHTHRAGLLVRNVFGKVMFEMDIGNLADENQIPLQYGPNKHINQIKSIGFVDHNGPRIITL